MNHEMKRNLSAVDKSIKVLAERHAKLLDKLPSQTTTKPVEENTPSRQRTVMRSKSLDLPESPSTKTKFLPLSTVLYEDNDLSVASSVDSSRHDIPEIIVSTSSPELIEEDIICDQDPPSRRLSSSMMTRGCLSESNSPYNSDNEELVESPLSSSLNLPQLTYEEGSTALLARGYKDVMQENALILKRLSVKRRGSASTATELLRAKSSEDLRQSFSTNSSPRPRRKEFRNSRSLDEESECYLPRLSADKLNPAYLTKRRGTSPALPQIQQGSWSHRQTPLPSHLQKSNIPKKPGSALNAAFPTTESDGNNHLKLKDEGQLNIKCHSTNSSPILTRRKFSLA